jgi:competence protein ComEC
VLDSFPRFIQLTWYGARHAPVPRLVPGQRWRLAVRLKRPHGYANFRGYDSELALLQRNVRALGYVRAAPAPRLLPSRGHGLTLLLDRWRLAIRERVTAVLRGAPHEGIVRALAIGEQAGLTERDWERFRRTGTNHLVAISGLHVGLVASLAALLAGAAWRRSCWLGRGWPLRMPAQHVAALAAVAGAAVYAGLAGFGVPAQRALWMVTVAGAGYLSGRAAGASTILAWALGLVVLADPWAVVSAGFWLSFGAVAVILLASSARPRRMKRTPAVASADGSATEAKGADKKSAAGAVTGAPGDSPEAEAALDCARWREPLKARLFGWGGGLLEGTRVQWAITLGLVPLSLLWFAQISLVGPVANAFAIPWVSFLVTPAVLAGIALPAPLDGWAFQAAHGLLVVLVAGLDWIGRPAWAVWRTAAPAPFAMAMAAIGLLWWLMPPGWPLRWAAPLTWLPLLLPPPSAPAPGAFRMTVLDVGQGGATLIETARHTLLFDAGPGPEAGDTGRRVVAPYLASHGLARLDTLILSHADADHAGGAPGVLDSVEAGVLLASLPHGHRLWSAARERGASGLHCVAGQHWTWDGVRFDILWPPRDFATPGTNAGSCVLRIVRAGPGEGTAVLLTGDIEAAAERQIIARQGSAGLRSSLLLAPHHGSATSSTEAFLQSVRPSAAIFQVGYRNRFRHPHPRVVARYEALEADLSRTDRDGAIRVEGDTAGLRIGHFRVLEARYWMGR